MQNTHQSLPGSAGEHQLQQQFDSEKRALAFYNKQVLDRLAPLMQTFVEQQQWLFIATADQHGECDCSFRAGDPGFITVIDDKTVIYPEYRGNGVMASLGNITENPHIGMVMIDFLVTQVGLHINGRAEIILPDQLESAFHHDLDLLHRIQENTVIKKTECYVKVTIDEAYIHCSKHIPMFKKLDKTMHWGTDDTKLKGGDAFKVKHYPRPWVTPSRDSTE